MQAAPPAERATGKKRRGGVLNFFARVFGGRRRAEPEQPRFTSVSGQVIAARPPSATTAWRAPAASVGELLLAAVDFTGARHLPADQKRAITAAVAQQMEVNLDAAPGR